MEGLLSDYFHGGVYVININGISYGKQENAGQYADKGFE